MGMVGTWKMLCFSGVKVRWVIWSSITGLLIRTNEVCTVLARTDGMTKSSQDTIIIA